MRWSGATGAIARCKRVSTGCGRKGRFVPAWPWICGVKPTPKAVNKPSPYSIVHGLDKPGNSATVSARTREKEAHALGRAVESVDQDSSDVIGWLLVNRCTLKLLIGLRKGCRTGILGV